MLNIPECVKALYKTDGRTDVRKNFRVTFPYSSRADITNDQIVTESVRFNESIMSQNTFRFGLAEAPQISFETVGVANMMGMTIRCWSEIETTSLTAAEVETIEAGEWDGEYIALEDSDIGYAFFRLLLGEFVVDSCPRSHGAMTRRQVKATGRAINNSNMDAFTKWKLAQQYTSKTWNIDWDFLAPSVYGDTWKKAGKYFDATAVTGTQSTAAMPGFEIEFEDATASETERITCGINISARKIETYTFTTAETLRIIRSGCANLANLLRENISTAFETLEGEYTIDWAKSINALTGDPLGSRDACLDFAVTRMVKNTTLFRPTLEVSNPTPYRQIPFYLRTDLEDLDAVVNASIPTGRVILTIPYGINAFVISLFYPDSAAHQVTCAETIPDGATTEVYKLALKSDYAVDFPTLPLPTTLETKQNGVKYYGYVNSFSFKKLLMSFFETQGQFGRFKRDGSVEVYTLTTTPAEELSQSDLTELWWDESDVEPVGSVRVKFKTGKDEESTADISIGDGESVYDMTDNYMLTKWEFTLDEVTDLIQGKFAERAAVLTWTPTDATIRGLPYLEAGDWLTCDTGATDIAEVGFPMLDRQMDGIQVLTDDITSVSGKVTAVEVEEDDYE